MALWWRGESQRLLQAPQKAGLAPAILWQVTKHPLALAAGVNSTQGCCLPQQG